MKYVFYLMVLLFIFSDACEKELAPQLPSPTATKASQAAATDLPVTFMPATDLEWQVDSLTGALCFRVMQSERELHDFKKKKSYKRCRCLPGSDKGM